MRKKKKRRIHWKNLMFFCAGSFIFLFGFLIIYISTIKIPDFKSFEDQKVINSTKIYDRTGQILLYDLNQNVKRTDIPFDAMGWNIKNATVAVEDSTFYTNPGIRITSIIRATIADIFHAGSAEGGSTITQQLVKNTLLNSQKTIGRKIKEWILALKIDQSMPKEKILEYYLNEVPYGGDIYGIEEAAKTYFGVDASDLDLAQAAYLASIPQSPTYYSPYGSNRSALDDRKNYVLDRMLALKFISQADYNQAKSEVVTFLPQDVTGIKAPHFVFWIRDYLEQKYGEDTVLNGGLTVTTTLDYNLEQQAEQLVKARALYNEKNFNGSNAAAVAIDPKTGQVLAMVGSRDFFDTTIDGQFNVATATRQPGSTFKPFVYATAFEKGFTPDTVLFDLPTEFENGCDPYGKAYPGTDQSTCYMPQDFDGLYRGPVSLRTALALSLNIPSIQLLYLAGEKDSLDTAKSMGISTLSDDPNQYGLTLVLGGGEVSLLDMTSAYGVFANNGVRNPYTGILSVKDINGNTLESYTQNSEQVLQPNIAETISDVLSDNVAKEPEYGTTGSPFIFPGREVAAKTGTTNDSRDAWTIGYTPDVVIGVWAGNNDNTPMVKNIAGLIVAPLWRQLMDVALANTPPDDFIKEAPIDQSIKPVLRGFWQGNDHFYIDKISGLLATADTPDSTKEEEIITNVHNILYWVDKNNILGPAPANPSDDPQFKNWEVPVQNWWAANSYKYPITTWADEPTASDNVHTDANKPIVAITVPDTTTVYPQNQKINLQINSTGHFPLQKIDIFINGTYLGTSQAPFNFSFTPSQLDNLKAQNDIKIISYDTADNSAETDSTFNVAE